MGRAAHATGRSGRTGANALAGLAAMLAGCAGSALSGPADPTAAAPATVIAPAPRSPPVASEGQSMSNADAALRAMIRAALDDAARRAAPAAVPPALVSAARVTWPDGSIGCPAPGMVYTMALVPGHRIRVRSGNTVLDYHAGLRGVPVLCPAGRATEPVADSRI